MSRIITAEFNLDLERLKKDARRINTKVIKQYKDIEIPTDKRYQSILADQLSEAPLSSRLHDHYNVFAFPYDGINQLYKEICTLFKETNKYDQPYYVHAWLNYQHKGEGIPLHQHWGGLSGLPNTYVCSFYVNAEPSKTTYNFPNDEVIINVNKNNTATIYEDVGDIHEVEVWQGDEPRISISMDFVPMKYIQGSPFILNTWIPVL